MLTRGVRAGVWRTLALGGMSNYFRSRLEALCYAFWLRPAILVLTAIVLETAGLDAGGEHTCAARHGVRERAALAKLEARHAALPQGT